MSSITQVLQEFENGDEGAADRLLVLIYDELRSMAAWKMALERESQTLDATGLVHEAYLRMFRGEQSVGWQNRRHFFGAAAEAMRRILIESARRRNRLKRGGSQQRVELEDLHGISECPELLVALDESLSRLNDDDPASAEIARLRLFAGLTMDDAADCLQVSRATAYRNWSYARAWLQQSLADRD